MPAELGSAIDDIEGSPRCAAQPVNQAEDGWFTIRWRTWPKHSNALIAYRDAETQRGHRKDLQQEKCEISGAETGAAAAGGFHVRVIEFETRAFQALHVVHFRPVQVQHARLIDEHL